MLNKLMTKVSVKQMPHFILASLIAFMAMTSWADCTNGSTFTATQDIQGYSGGNPFDIPPGTVVTVVSQSVQTNTGITPWTLSYATQLCFVQSCSPNGFAQCQFLSQQTTVTFSSNAPYSTNQLPGSGC